MERFGTVRSGSMVREWIPPKIINTKLGSNKKNIKIEGETLVEWAGSVATELEIPLVRWKKGQGGFQGILFDMFQYIEELQYDIQDSKQDVQDRL